jgi:hypothetical protein
MSKKELEIQIRKNILDIEHGKLVNFYLACITLFITIIGMGIAFIQYLNLNIMSIEGELLISFFGIAAYFFLFLAIDYRRKYKSTFEQIRGLLKEAER